LELAVAVDPNSPKTTRDLKVPIGLADELRHPLLQAASRKIAIASFHESELSQYVNQHQPLPNQAPVPVQAHFEGVLYAYVAASDKIEEAILGVLEPRPKIPRGTRGWDRFRLIVHALNEVNVAQRLVIWSADPFFADARWVRNQATHAYYEKQHPATGLPAIGDWQVEEPRRGGLKAYDSDPDSRRLRAYCCKAVEHLQALGDLLPDLDQHLFFTF
jgi:hypothetical protein